MISIVKALDVSTHVETLNCLYIQWFYLKCKQKNVAMLKFGCVKFTSRNNNLVKRLNLPWHESRSGSPILIDSFCNSRVNIGGGPEVTRLKIINCSYRKRQYYC